MATQLKSGSQDFLQPWKFSDVVLVVEEKRLHVHRAVLAMFSPVFEKMFTSEFQEKDKNEVPLPGKKSSEVQELLLMIYPSDREEKQITEKNCLYLVKLAHEYQMDAIVRRCEDYIVKTMKTESKNVVLATLVFAQTYKLEKVRRASIDQVLAHNLSLRELKNDKMYNEVEMENFKEIMEGIIMRLQRELSASQSTTMRLQRELSKSQSTIESLQRQQYIPENAGIGMPVRAKCKTFKKMEPRSSQEPRNSQNPLRTWPCKTRLLLFLGLGVIVIVFILLVTNFRIPRVDFHWSDWLTRDLVF